MRTSDGVSLSCPGLYNPSDLPAGKAFWGLEPVANEAGRRESRWGLSPAAGEARWLVTSPTGIPSESAVPTGTFGRPARRADCLGEMGKEELPEEPNACENYERLVIGRRAGGRLFRHECRGACIEA